MGRHVRVNKIETSQDIANDMRRIYREVRRGETDISDGKGMVWILKAIVEVMLDSTVEQRLSEIERKVQEQGLWRNARH